MKQKVESGMYASWNELMVGAAGHGVLTVGVLGPMSNDWQGTCMRAVRAGVVCLACCILMHDTLQRWHMHIPVVLCVACCIAVHDGCLTATAPMMHADACL